MLLAIASAWTCNIDIARPLKGEPWRSFSRFDNTIARELEATWGWLRVTLSIHHRQTPNLGGSGNENCPRQG